MIEKYMRIIYNMGNAWLKFMAEERASPENKDVPMLKLATHVRPKYDAWKEKNGLSTGGVEEKTEKKAEVAVEDKAEVTVEEKTEVVVEEKKVHKKNKNKTNKKNKKSRGRKSRGRRY
jgi:outer membrane biosynthesis protein TonB